MPQRVRVPEPLAWCLALTIAVVALVAVEFASQDPDSTLYAGISSRLGSLPLRTWIAPEWWGLWNMQGPFLEHPVGVFLLPAVLAKAGFPALQAAFAVGALCSMLFLPQLRGVASLIVGDRRAAIVPWAALIVPAAFINRIRATQEYPLLVLILLAIYATEKSRRSASWIPVSIAAACATVLVKGLFVVFIPIVCALWLLCMREKGQDDRRAWLGIAASAISVVLCALVYESLYQGATGQSFLDHYLFHRLNQIGPVGQTSTPLLLNTLNNLGWYSVRLLWFGFPGSLLLLIAAATRSRHDRPATPRREMQGLYFAISLAVANVAIMSLGSTRAERYILPAYFAIGIAGTLVAVRHWGAGERLDDWLAKLPPSTVAFAWLVLVLAALPFELYVPYVKFRT